MSRPAGPVRQAVLRCLSAGITGTYEAIAAAAGVEARRARATLKEIRRAGQAPAPCRQRAAGRPGAARGVWGQAATDSMDTLGFARQVWR